MMTHNEIYWEYPKSVDYEYLCIPAYKERSLESQLDLDWETNKRSTDSFQKSNTWSDNVYVPTNWTIQR